MDKDSLGIVIKPNNEAHHVKIEGRYLIIFVIVCLTALTFPHVSNMRTTYFSLVFSLLGSVCWLFLVSDCKYFKVLCVVHFFSFKRYL